MFQKYSPVTFFPLGKVTQRNDLVEISTILKCPSNNEIEVYTLSSQIPQKNDTCIDLLFLNITNPTSEILVSRDGDFYQILNNQTSGVFQCGIIPI